MLEIHVHGTWQSSNLIVYWAVCGDGILDESAIRLFVQCCSNFTLRTHVGIRQFIVSTQTLDFSNISFDLWDMPYLVTLNIKSDIYRILFQPIIKFNDTFITLQKLHGNLLKHFYYTFGICNIVLQPLANKFH